MTTPVSAITPNTRHYHTWDTVRPHLHLRPQASEGGFELASTTIFQVHLWTTIPLTPLKSILRIVGYPLPQLAQAHGVGHFLTASPTISSSAYFIVPSRAAVLCARSMYALASCSFQALETRASVQDRPRQSFACQTSPAPEARLNCRCQ